MLGKRASKSAGKGRQRLGSPGPARVRQGWEVRGGRIRLIRPGEEDTVARLMDMAGIELNPYLRSAIADASVSSALLAGLDAGTQGGFFGAAVRAFAKPRMVEGLAPVSLLLAAESTEGEVVGLVAGMPPVALMTTALSNGYPAERAVVLAVAITKIEALAVAEHVRGRGFAAALLRRAAQVYQHLGFLLTYGSFDIARDLENFYTRQGFSVGAVGEVLSMERLGLPFLAHAGAEEQLFHRWHARR